MNLGVWATIVAILVKLWSFLGGGKGTRITFEARPEAAIEAERKALSELLDRIQEIQDAIDALSIRIAFEKGDGGDTTALDKQRNELLAKRRKARLKYDHQLRHCDAGGRHGAA